MTKTKNKVIVYIRPCWAAASFASAGIVSKEATDKQRATLANVSRAVYVCADKTQSYFMKKTTIAFTLACTLASFGLLMSCTKETAPLSFQQQIAGKWTIQNAIGNYTVNGSNRKDTTYFTPADYIQFNTDGTLSIHEGTNTPTGKWEINGANKLMITETNYMDYPNGFDISVLSGSNLQLYYTEANSFSTLEQKLNLSR